MSTSASHQAKQPLVSIIIPTRNRIRLLNRAVKSVEAQTYPNIELIIIDNHAEKPLLESDINYARPLKIVRSDKMLLLPDCRNYGASIANGEYISFLDDDDEILPRKISDHVEAYIANPNIDYVYGNTRHIGPKSKTILVSRGPCDLTDYLHWRHIHTNALTFHKNIFLEEKYSSDMETYEDVEFIGRLLSKFNGHYINEEHAIWYRDQRSDQITVKRDYHRAYENWKRLCERFDSVIKQQSVLRRFYHSKMLLLSLRYGDFKQAAYSVKMLLGL